MALAEPEGLQDVFIGEGRVIGHHPKGRVNQPVYVLGGFTLHVPRMPAHYTFTNSEVGEVRRAGFPRDGL